MESTNGKSENGAEAGAFLPCSLLVWCLFSGNNCDSVTIAPAEMLSLQGSSSYWTLIYYFFLLPLWLWGRKWLLTVSIYRVPPNPLFAPALCPHSVSILFVYTIWILVLAGTLTMLLTNADHFPALSQPPALVWCEGFPQLSSTYHSTHWPLFPTGRCALEGQETSSLAPHPQGLRQCLTCTKYLITNCWNPSQL